MGIGGRSSAHAENDSTAIVFAEGNVVTLFAKHPDTGLRRARCLAKVMTYRTDNTATLKRDANGRGGERSRCR